MAKRGSNEVGFILVDGYNLLGVSTAFEDNLEALLEDTTPFGSGWEVKDATGLKKASITQDGYYDDAARSSNAALSGQEGVSRILCYGLEGNLLGAQFVGYTGALQVNYNRIASRGELHRANARYEGNGAVESGRIIHPLATRTADGDTEATPYNNGAGSADGGAAYLQLTGLTLGGYTSLLVTVRESDDGLVWGDLESFAAATAAGRQRITVAGAVKQYLAVEWEFVGAGADPSATFFVGFVRN